MKDFIGYVFRCPTILESRVCLKSQGKRNTFTQGTCRYMHAIVYARHQINPMTSAWCHYGNGFRCGDRSFVSVARTLMWGVALCEHKGMGQTVQR
jgi:hypothetical protein